jgi:hypothetical protein
MLPSVYSVCKIMGMRICEGEYDCWQSCARHCNGSCHGKRRKDRNFVRALHYNIVSPSLFF